MGWIENCFSPEMASRMNGLPMKFQPVLAPSPHLELNDLVVWTKTDRRTPGRLRHIGAVASLTATGVELQSPPRRKKTLWTLPTVSGTPEPGCSVSGNVVHHWLNPRLEDGRGRPICLDPKNQHLEGWKPDVERLFLVVGILTATEVRVIGLGASAETSSFSDIPFAVSVVELGYDAQTGELRLLNDEPAGFLGPDTYPRHTVRLWPMQMLGILDTGANSEQPALLSKLPPLPEPPPLSQGEGSVPPVLAYRNRSDGMLAPCFDAGTTDLKKDGRLIGVAYVATQSGSTTEETLAASDAPALRMGAGAKETLAATGASKQFLNEVAFRAGAWSYLKWPEGTTAVYQRAVCKVETFDASGALAKCKSWGLSPGQGLAVRVRGKSSGGTSMDGWVITGQDVEGPEGSRKRTIRQIIPVGMVLPPKGEVSMTEVALESEDLVGTMMARLGEAGSRVLYEVASCECTVRSVRNSWQLLGVEAG